MLIRCEIKRAFLGTLFFITFLLPACSEDEFVIFTFVNHTDESIDIRFLSSLPGYDNEWEHYRDLEIRDIDSFEGCTICNLGSQESAKFTDSYWSGIPATIFARTSFDKRIIYSRTFTYNELEQSEFIITVDGNLDFQN